MMLALAHAQIQGVADVQPTPLCAKLRIECVEGAHIPVRFFMSCVMLAKGKQLSQQRVVAWRATARAVLTCRRA